MSTIHRVELDSTLRCPDAVDFERRLRERVVGQDEAIDRVTRMVQTFMAGFNPPNRPAGILLILGPTGLSALKTSGKPGPSLPSLASPYLQFTATGIPLSPLCVRKIRGLQEARASTLRSKRLLNRC